MLFILQVSILSEQLRFPKGTQAARPLAYLYHHEERYLLLLLLLWFICRPPIKDIVLALAGLFEALFYLFLHFVLLV